MSPPARAGSSSESSKQRLKMTEIQATSDHLGASIHQHDTAYKVDNQENDADDEEDQHRRGQPHHSRVILIRKLISSILLEDCVHSPPELHGFKSSLIFVILLVASGFTIPAQHVDDHPGQVESVGEGDGHGDDGEDGHGEGGESHHDSAGLESDTTTTVLEESHHPAGEI